MFLHICVYICLDALLCHSWSNTHKASTLTVAVIAQNLTYTFTDAPTILTYIKNVTYKQNRFLADPVTVNL